MYVLQPMMRLPRIVSMLRRGRYRLHFCIIIALASAVVILCCSFERVGLGLQSLHWPSSSSQSQPLGLGKRSRNNANVPAPLRVTYLLTGLRAGLYGNFSTNGNGDVGEIVQNLRVSQSTTLRPPTPAPILPNKDGGQELVGNTIGPVSSRAHTLAHNDAARPVAVVLKPSVLRNPVKNKTALIPPVTSTVSVNLSPTDESDEEPLPDVGQEKDTISLKVKIKPRTNTASSAQGSSSMLDAKTATFSVSASSYSEIFTSTSMSVESADYVTQFEDHSASTPSERSQKIAGTPSVPTSSSSTTTTQKPVEELSAVDEIDSLSDSILRLEVRRPQAPRNLPGGPWQALEGGEREVYLMSAYLDERPALDRPRVAVIGLAEPEGANLYCLFWYANRDRPTVHVADVIPIGQRFKPRKLKTYEQDLFACELSDAETERPTEVSIITATNVHPTTLLPVRVPVRPASPSDVIEFGHCMSILYRRQDPYRVVEWIELHRLWGVREFNFYAHRLDNATLAVLERYSREGLARVSLVPPALLDSDDDEEAILMNMSPVINDCAYRNMYRYRYVVVTDMDEMIVPRQHDNYSALIEAIEASRKANVQTPLPPVVHSYLFRNAYFFLDFGPTSDEPRYSTTLRYQRRVKPSRYGYSSKSITRALSCVGLQNHFCWEWTEPENRVGRNVDVAVALGLNQHYKRCHFDEYLHKEGVCRKMIRDLGEPMLDSSMERFRERLLERMNERLEKK